LQPKTTESPAFKSPNDTAADHTPATVLINNLLNELHEEKRPDAVLAANLLGRPQPNKENAEETNHALLESIAATARVNKAAHLGGVVIKVVSCPFCLIACLQVPLSFFLSFFLSLSFSLSFSLSLFLLFHTPLTFLCFFASSAAGETHPHSSICSTPSASRGRQAPS
jgi:hypothetical protein